MAQVDLKKTPKRLYGSSAQEVVVVDVPPMNFLMVDGEGDPSASASYKHADGALYAVSYALKFMVKKGETAVDYAVMPPVCGGRTTRRRSTSVTGTHGSGRR